MNYEIILIAILLFFITSAIVGHIDGGLYSSLYCASNGETDECFERLKNAK